LSPHDDSDGPSHRGGCWSLDDLGGVGLPDGTVFATAQAPTRGAGPVVDTIFALIDRALAAAKESRLRVAGIGLGLPGLVDVEKGFMRSMPFSFLTDLGDVPLASLIHARTGHSVFVDNDVNALALGEWMFGLGPGTSSLATVAIGTGIGAGLIVDRRLVAGISTARRDPGLWR
jgi:glucokinase